MFWVWVYLFVFGVVVGCVLFGICWFLLWYLVLYFELFGFVNCYEVGLCLRGIGIVFGVYWVGVGGCCCDWGFWGIVVWCWWCGRYCFLVEMLGEVFVV